MCVCVQLLSHVQLFVTPWTVACQAPLSMEFSRQEYWSGLPCPLPRDLPDPGVEPTSLMSSASAGGFFTTAAAAKSLQSCLTLCDPVDGSPTGSPVPGILQARIVEWVAISFSNAWKWKVKVKLLSRVRLLATPWTAAYQAPPSMGFSRQEYWSGVLLSHLILNSMAEHIKSNKGNKETYVNKFPMLPKTEFPRIKGLVLVSSRFLW